MQAALTGAFDVAECIAAAEVESSSSAPSQNGAAPNKSNGFVSQRSVRLQRSFPMTAVVGMDHIKQALLLGACDTGLGGICIAGKRGTCKVGSRPTSASPLRPAAYASNLRLPEIDCNARKASTRMLKSCTYAPNHHLSSVHVQSVLARGLHALLPPIEVIKGSYCNANPENRREWEVHRRPLINLSSVPSLLSDHQESVHAQ